MLSWRWRWSLSELRAAEPRPRERMRLIPQRRELPLPQAMMQVWREAVNGR
jgi:hypothetical protein